MMLILVINGKKLPNVKDIANDLKENFKNLKTIVINSNMKNTNENKINMIDKVGRI